MKTLAELQAVYQLPLPDLVLRAAEVHRAHHDYGDVQRCALLSIKTGGCPEDCGYCAQSARFKTGVEATPLLSLDEVRKKAARAKIQVEVVRALDKLDKQKLLERWDEIVSRAAARAIRKLEAAAIAPSPAQAGA